MNTSMHPHFDLIVIGAGPAGLAFCRSLAGSHLKIALVDVNSAETLANPPVDGREVSIIRNTERLLEKLGTWQRIDDKDKHALASAKVFNGDSDYALNFSVPKNDRQLLGYFVPNHLIRKALYEAFTTQHNVTPFFEQKVTKVQTDGQSASVTLDNGDILRAKLVVSADSRYSEIRKTMGISTNIRDFGRSVIIFRMNHERSNQLTAMECFHYGRTMAVLPLGENTSSIVITIDSSKVEALYELNAQDTVKDVEAQLKNQLGEMTLVSQKHCYPLFGVHANRFYAKRYALIGDTAVGMHPVTAQGFNLGMQSQSMLAQAILEAEDLGKDIGDEKLLSAYSRKHMKSTLPLYHGTNAIVKLFTNDDEWAKPLRHFVLRAGNHFHPFKYFVNKRLTG